MRQSSRPSRFLRSHLAATLVLGTIVFPTAEAMGGKRHKGKKPAGGKSGLLAPLAAGVGPDFEAKVVAPPEGLLAIPEPSKKQAKVQGRLATAPAVRILNRDAFRPGADLRGVKCEPGFDLSGLNLRGADLSFADLRGAIMTGTRLEGARLFMADTRGAVGIDLSEAEIHPFFETRPGEPEGAVTYFEVGSLGPSAWLPGQMASTRGQHLAWLSQDGKMVRCLTVTGAIIQVTAPDPHRHLGLAVDSEDNLYLLGEKGTTVVPLETFLAPEDSLSLMFYREGVKGRPQATAFDEEGGLWVSTPGRVTFLRGGDRRLVVSHRELGDLKSASGADRVAPLPRSSPWVSAVAPSRDGLLVVDLIKHVEHVIPLPPGSKAQALAEAADGAMWCTLSGLGSLVRIDPAGAPSDPSDWKVTYFPLIELDGVNRTPHALARGEDGNLWFTDPGACRIGRVTPEGEVAEFPLEPGHRPVEWAASSDGRMYFTVAGKDLIGSIRAVAVPAEAEMAPAQAKEGEITASPSGFEFVLARPKPQRAKPLNRGERWERTMRAEHAAWEALAAAEAGPAPAETKAPLSWTEIAQLHPVFETKADRPAVAPPVADTPPAKARLTALRLAIQPGMAELILGKHGWGKNPKKSQFSEAFSSEEGFEEMLAAGLAGARIGGRVGRDGRFYSFFHLEGAGRLGGPAAPATDRVLVITSEYWDTRARKWMHDLVNAYPMGGDS